MTGKLYVIPRLADERLPFLTFSGQSLEVLELWLAGVRKNLIWRLPVATPKVVEDLRVVLYEDPTDELIAPAYTEKDEPPPDLEGMKLRAYTSKAVPELAAVLIGGWIAAWVSTKEEGLEIVERLNTQHQLIIA